MNYESQYLWVLTKLWFKMLKAKYIDALDQNRTGVKTVSLFGQVLKARVKKNRLPVLTTKYIHLHSVIVELIWFLKGDSNISFLVKNGVNIWTPNAFAHNRNKAGFPDITMTEYFEMLKNNEKFGEKFGSLGGVYGAIWRNFSGVDQIERALNTLKTKPESRQNLVLAWNPVEIPNVALPPCHFAFQIHVKSGVISLSVYQRSADWFLGVPFNITSYSLLLLLFAEYTGFEPGYVYMHFGDAHLYENHFKQAMIQISRWLLKRRDPQVYVNKDAVSSDLKSLKESDINVVGYKHRGKIKASMAV